MTDTTTTSAPDAGYVRTDEELAYQRTYERREASLHRSTARIHYRVIEGRPDGNVIVRKVAWRVGRQIDGAKEALSPWLFRKVDVIAYLKEQTQRDNVAAKRLGVMVHVTTSR